MTIRGPREAHLRPPAPPPAPAPAPAPAPDAAATAPSPFARLVRAVGDEAVRGERVVRGAVAASAAGKDLGPAELIALQAGVYRYSEAVDLAAKLVDRASSGVKTVVTGQ